MPSETPLHVVGLSHHTAGVGVREQFALTPAEVSAWLARFDEQNLTALILSTCNRCELYWYGDGDHEAAFREFARARGVADTLALERREGAAAIQHLFTVAAGLDSQVLGETEILGQVRRAYDLARAAGTTTRQMDLVFSAALSTGRKVRRETMLGRHPTSVSSAAVDLAASYRGGDLAGCRVVVLGAGEAAEGVLRALHARGATHVVLVNRHAARAAALAAAWNATPHTWEELPALAAEAEILAVATASARPLVSAALLETAVSGREDGQVLVLDLAVPRNVEPAARHVAGVRLLDLDDLQRLCCPAADAPSDALADAERILAHEMMHLDQSLHGRTAAPRLTELHRLGAQVAAQETEWALGQLAALSEREREVVREMAERLVRRVLYPVSRSLRSPEEPLRAETPAPESGGTPD